MEAKVTLTGMYSLDTLKDISNRLNTLVDETELDYENNGNLFGVSMDKVNSFLKEEGWKKYEMNLREVHRQSKCHYPILSYIAYRFLDSYGLYLEFRQTTYGLNLLSSAVCKLDDIFEDND